MGTNDECRARRAASFLLGVAAGLSSAPRDASAKWRRQIAPLAEKIRDVLPVAAALHNGDGWFNPVQIFEMEIVAEQSGFDQPGRSVIAAVGEACGQR
jgi:hypothetical protein